MPPAGDDFLREAIALSRANIDSGGGPFGAVVVRDGAVVGRGQNHVVPDRDPTAHAEVVAIRDACARLGTHDLSGCVIYASCEPCPMCLGAIYWARIERIVHAATREDAAEAGFDDAFFYEELARPVPEREVPTEQRLREEGAAVLHLWRDSADKTPY